MAGHLRTLVLLAVATVGCQSGNSARHRSAEYLTFSTASNPTARADKSEEIPNAARPVSFNNELSDSESLVRVPRLGETADLVELESLVLQTSPAVSEAAARVESLRGKLVQAGLPPNPVVGLNAEDINEGGSSGRYGIFFGREIIRGNKLQLAGEVVLAELEVAEQELEVVRQKALTDVRQEFYEVLVAQERIHRIDELVAISKRAVEISEQLVEALETPKTSLLQAEMEFENNKVLRRQADNQLDRAKRRLAALLGQPELPFDSVNANFETLQHVESFENSLEELVSSSPQVASLIAEIEKERRNVLRQCAEPIPNVTWQTSIQFDLATDDIVSGFQFGMPIPLLNQNQGAISRAQQNLAAAEKRAEKATFDLTQKLATTYQGFRDSKIQVEAFENRLIPKAQETLELVTQGYKQGEISFLQWLTAQRTYSQTQLNYLEQIQFLCRNYWHLRGMLLRNSLSE